LRGRIAPLETGGLALYVTLDETRRDVLVATDGNTERIDLTMTAAVRLETAADEVVEQRRFRVSSSYNRTSSELANKETEASLRNAALDRIASDIQFLLADLSADADPAR
jgi:outer membrane lipopolysaccharide assembly protein LptE/RlpB